MDKLDLKKARKHLFTAPHNHWVPIEVPEVSYLMVDGHGDPNSTPDYVQAIESLYATAYTIKFKCKAAGRDFVVAPLEGLWSAEDPASFTARRKDEWDWAESDGKRANEQDDSNSGENFDVIADGKGEGQG